MSNDTFEVVGYDQEVGGKWYATVLIIHNGQPSQVCRVPSDPPTYSEIEAES